MQAQLAARNGLPTCRPVPATGLRLSAATRVTGERAGVSRRTVRYYVQQSLLAAPRGLARGKHYTPAHLATLVRNLTMQEGGTPLAMIAAALGVEQSSPPKRVHDAARASVRADPHDRIDPRADRFQRIDIEAAVGLIEDCEARRHDAHLDHLRTLLLAT